MGQILSNFLASRTNKSMAAGALAGYVIALTLIAIVSEILPSPVWTKAIGFEALTVANVICGAITIVLAVPLSRRIAFMINPEALVRAVEKTLPTPTDKGLWPEGKGDSP